MTSIKQNAAKRSLLGLSKTLLAVGILVLGCATSAKAAIGTGELTADQVNVRSDAGTTAAKVTTLPKGSQMVIDGVKADAGGKYWYQVSFTANGKSYSGYILGDYVRYSAGTAQSQSAQSDTTTKKKKKKKAKQQEAQQTQSADGAVTEVRVPESINEMVIAEAEKAEQTKSASAESTVAGESARTGVKGQKALGTGDYIRVRKSPVTGVQVSTLMKNTKVTLISEKKGSDGMTWYRVKFKGGGKTVKGYVRSDLLALQPRAQKVTDTKKTAESEEDEDEEEEEEETVPEAVILSDAQFEAEMTAQGFPESYKKGLRALHEQHPTWSFKAKNTGLDWNTALTAESRVGLNLVSKGSITSWKSTETAAYNWRKNIWYTFDGGSWVAASQALIAYYMDPRNFLSDPQIYQFETLEREAYQTKAGVNQLLAGTFMSGKYTEPDGTRKSYANTFVKVGKQVGVNPYHLAARCYQEQGAGYSDSISGKVAGLENIFNYFNIGAYASGGNSPTRQGLLYASSTSAGTANYNRPWNSRYQSILGGSMYLAEKYVKTGQNTLYFQKFNVVNATNGLYRHQYMANVQAASSEATRMSKAYKDNEQALVFYIPVYQNMPEKACEMPMKDANPNDYLTDLTVEGFELTPAFDGMKTEYTLTVKKKVTNVVIGATPASATSVVSGIGEAELERGENTFVIKCQAAAGNSRDYTLKIIRK
ncbi:MAG: SH3 domain-containing protein [Lachnospiraceae bacterium]|nr:SH3 domain-containing protein [Lachnospiraceae bacterium]